MKKLRRELGVWGSFTWGYADVGADVYVALGLVFASAQGWAPLAFAVAGLLYILVGLAHTELASSYPVAGGVKFWTLRSLGDFFGFIAGAALLLDYTIDIALFATASAGYINFFFPEIREYRLSIGPFEDVNWIWLAESLSLILLLALLNIRGIRESSFLNSFVGLADMILETSIICGAFVLAWRSDMFVEQWKMSPPPVNDFLYATTIAIISFVGIESIAQAAEETRRPSAVIPRSSKALIIAVLMFAIAFPSVALGVVDWHLLAEREGDPVAALTSKIPFFGFIGGSIAALLGATIILISANTGIMGASRTAFSMGEYGLMGKQFGGVHPKYHTPVRAILFFSFIAAIQTIVGFLSGPRAMETLVDMYAFGATLAYFLGFLALIALRFQDPLLPRPFSMPFNITLKNGVRFPVLAVLGALGTLAMLIIILMTHPLGRVAGPLWLLGWIIYYIVFRVKSRLPIFASVPRNWIQEQLNLLESAEENESLETYLIRLKDQGKI
ncbi:MAG: APC family permease [bacterium JZ-2024 1]